MSHGVLGNSPNSAMNKTVLNKFLALPVPDNKVQVTYIWIDGTGEGIRAKDRTLNFVPKEVSGKRMKLWESNVYLIPILCMRWNLHCYS